MKHFKAIIIAIIGVICALFALNILFLVSLYDSIKARYIDDVEQCLRRADLIELIDRIDRAGLADDRGVVEMWIGLQKSDIGAAKTPDELRAINYSQGYKRLDRQLISITEKYLHNTYGDTLPEPDTRLLEEAFRREMNFSGYFPEYVTIIGADGCCEYSTDRWELEHRVDGELIYTALISPLTKNILLEMSGIISVTAAIAIIIIFAFWYLFRIISRLRSLEEMKDDFTNNMTHELKTPIAIAYAANDALLQFPDPGDTARTRKYLTASLNQLSRLTAMVENILAMSMERRKNRTISKEEINLASFIEAVVEQQEIKVKKRCIFNIKCTETATVNADPTHLANIINNLIDNSIKYSGESVEITIEADERHLTVTDNGIGISKKHLPDIFDKFYRVPNGNRLDVRGYGIGLFYVKSIIDKHGWSIVAESQPGKGTKFTITF